MIGFGASAAKSSTWEAEMAYGVSVAGKWSYRSYLNTADQRIFGQRIFTFTPPSTTTLKGTLDMGGRFLLDLDGSVRPPDKGSSLSLPIKGSRRAGTKTEGW